MLDGRRRARVHFDTVQMPVNVMDAALPTASTSRVLPELVKTQIGVLGMKPLGSGLFLKQRAAGQPDGHRRPSACSTR